MNESTNYQCCIAGGGPAGMMLGYLLGRYGVKTLVLEKHGDFLRDFRGDTVHPSTLQVMHELGLLESFLKRPHQKLEHISGWFGSHRIELADFRGLDLTCPYVAFMPQWEFLDFLAGEGRHYPNLTVMMNAKAEGLLRDGGQVTGVRVATEQGELEVRASLTIAADGRHSTLRADADLPVQDIGAPIDVLWFRIGKDQESFDEAFTYVGAGRILICLDRGDYFQCAYVIPKDGADALKKRGLDTLKRDLAELAPGLATHVSDLKTWDDLKLLSVSVDRLERWSLPGLLCIGDAAHAMSPVGGIGINLAIQDAVATANLLAEKLRSDTLSQDDLTRVQHRRAFPTRVTQALQVQVQDRVLDPVLSGENASLDPPIFLKLLTHSAWLRHRAARMLGMGVRPEHVQLRFPPT